MCDASHQLARETQWLRGEIPASMLALRKDKRSQLTSIDRKIEEVLQKPQLRKFLALLDRHNKDVEKHNKDLGRYDRDQRRATFLLAPYLFHAVSSVDARLAAVLKMPAIDQPTAEVRKHFQDASTKSKVLAQLLRKAPQPHFALSARNDLSDAIALFSTLPTLTAESEADTIEPLDRVLERAAELLEHMAQKISRARQHRWQGRKASEARQLQLRSQVANLAGVFRKQLGHPYHSHVAMIATLMSRISTNSDYVKKVDNRNLRRSPGDKLPKNRKQSVP